MAASIKSQSHSKTALLLGAGYCARALIPSLKSRGYEVVATSRTQAKSEALHKLGAKAIIYDGTMSAQMTKALASCDILLSSIPPNNLGDPFLYVLDTPLLGLAKNTAWAGYLSATSVYGDRQGHWAFEDELLRPTTARGKNRGLAELQWLETGLPVHVFRLAGIYGPGRSNFQRLREGKARAVIKPGHIVNRIHVDDIVSAILASLDKPNPVSLYNIADGHPAPPQEVINFSADLLDLPRPPQLDHSTANISDMARSFYRETKRINIERAQTELGWSPKYSNYRQGLMATLKAENEEPNSIWLTGYIEVPQEDLSQVKRALPTHIRLSQQEEDCDFFRIWQDEDEPTKFHVMESFNSAKAYHRHQARMKNSEWALISHRAVRHYDIIGL